MMVVVPVAVVASEMVDVSVSDSLGSVSPVVALEPDEPLGHTSLSIFYQKKGMIPEAEDEKALAMRLTMEREN